MAITHAGNFTEFMVIAGNTQSQTRTCTATAALVAACYNLTNNADIGTDIGGAGFTLAVAKDATQGSGGSNINHQLNIAGGSTVVNVTYPGGSADFGAYVMEFTDVATSSALDVTGSNEDDTTNNPTATPSPGLTTTDTDVAVVTYSMDRNASPTAQANWTLYAATGTKAGWGAAAFRIFTGTTSGERGAINFGTGAHYAACIATYKQAAGGGGSTRPVKFAGAWHGYAGRGGGFAS